MQEINAEDHPFTCQEVSREQAIQMLQGQTYKLERLADIPEGDLSLFFHAVNSLISVVTVC